MRNFLILIVIFVHTGIISRGAETNEPITRLHQDSQPLKRPCYPGAYYRKVVSSMDYWIGITGKVKLPKITFDQSRLNKDKPGEYLDNPTIYMGGNMDGQETDIGLTWEVIKEQDGSISKERKAYRPFFRRNAYGKSKQKFTWISGPPHKDFYWYPGDVVTISVKIVRDGVLQFIVEGEGKRYETEVECDAYIFNRKGEFKRVNAIDQVGNENKPVEPTQTKVTKAKWFYTYLYKNKEGKEVKTPLNSSDYTEMRCPNNLHFPIQNKSKIDAKAGEKIDILGTIR